MYFAFLYNFWSKYFLLYEEFSAIPQMHTGLHVKCLSFVSDFSGNLISHTDFLDGHEYKIYKNRSIRSSVFPYGRTDSQKWRS